MRKKKDIRAQATLELAVAMIGVFLLFFCSLKIFTWLNMRLIHRHQLYEDTRVDAAGESSRRFKKPLYVSERDLPRLEIFER